MKNILDNIVAHKQVEVDKLKKETTILKFKKLPLFDRKCVSLSETLAKNQSVGIIAEFKRKSPSKGLINIHNNTVSTTCSDYQNAKASAISVLTDKHFFGAESNDFSTARESTNLPILRKEFIIDPIQVYQSKAMGADLILLIGAILNKEQSHNLSHLAHDLGMEVIYEIHSEEEIALIPNDIKIVGINNRDLKYFKVDFDRSMNMFNQLPNNILKIAESGISEPQTVIKLKQKGFNGFLIGENFMKTKNPGATCSDFIKSCNQEGIC